MTGDATIHHPTASASGRTERFRRAEEAVWRHHGLAPRERFLMLEDPRVRLRVLEVGSGRPILMAHGTVGPAGWPSLIEAMGGSGRFIVVDRPGWGGSGPLDIPGPDYRRVAADVLRGVVDALSLDRVVVVGGSIGDVWALSFAERHPARVERVVLLGAGPLLAEVPPPGFIRLLASPLGALIVRLPMSADRSRTILRDSGHAASLAAGRIPDQFIDYRVALSNDSRAMRNERGMIHRLVRGRGWVAGFPFDAAALGRIAVPTLLVYGTRDAVGDVATWQRFVDWLPNGRLEVIEGAGHMPWFDEPGRVAASIERFLAT